MGHIAATPSLKEDHTIRIMVGKFDLDYNAFDNILASGKFVVSPLMTYIYNTFVVNTYYTVHYRKKVRAQ